MVITCKIISCSRAKTVNENLKMSGALLSRFDLVFILLDKPDEVLDKRLSEHIMSVSVLTPFCKCSCKLKIIKLCKKYLTVNIIALQFFFPIWRQFQLQ